MIYEIIYKKLDKLGVISIFEADIDYQKSQVSGYMDLNIDILSRDDDTIVIALSHLYEQNGDLCADPDMQIRIFRQMKMAEALTFQQAMPPIYQEAYPTSGQAYPCLKRELNSFLSNWLGNCIVQGHRFTVD